NAREGLEAPHHVWEVSPGLSGMAFYTGHPGSAWNDSLLLGSLAQRNLIRLSLDGDRIAGEERLLDEIGERVRDVRVGSDGKVYVVTDEPDGKLLQIPPARGLLSPWKAREDPTMPAAPSGLEPFGEPA